MHNCQSTFENMQHLSYVEFPTARMMLYEYKGILQLTGLYPEFGNLLFENHLTLKTLINKISTITIE